MKPILFNTEMVRAILEGRKTVTRRVVKPNQLIGIAPDNVRNKTPDGFIKNKPFLFKPYCDMSDKELVSSIYKSPYDVGDVLYVRETWCKLSKLDDFEEIIEDTEKYYYRADGSNPTPYNYFIIDGERRDYPKWKPSIHMPKAAARIFLKVTGVRVERLRDITNPEDEGLRIDCTIYDPEEKYYKKFVDFAELWDSTIKPNQLKYYSWEANPYVWVIEFERVDKCSD